MSIELFSCDWEYECNAAFWAGCLTLAEAFGWRPAGTLAPCVRYETPTGWEYYGDPDMEWSGGYCTNDYQQVTDDDARAFAAGLKRAIDAVMMESPLTVEQTKAIKIFGKEVGYFDFPPRRRKTTSVQRVAGLAALTGRSGFVIA